MIYEVNVRNTKMKYFKFGSGKKNMVIVPGLSIKSVMESEMLVSNQYCVLKDDFTVYCFDRIDNPKKDYSIKEMASDLLIAIKELGLKDIFLFGTSQGGMICLSMILLDESLFKKVLVSSTTMKVEDYLNKCMTRFVDYAKNNETEKLIMDFSKLIYPNEYFLKLEGFLKELAKEVSKEELDKFIIFASSIKDFNIIDKIGSINIDILFVHDIKDELISIDSFYKLKEMYSYKNNFKYYTYDGFGHVLYDTDPNFPKFLLDYYRR